MNVKVRFDIDEKHRNEITFSGPDSICFPVLKYLAIQLVNVKRTFSVHFVEEEPET